MTRRRSIKVRKGTGRWTAIFALLLAVAAAHATGLEPGPVSDDPIWTDKPVRIDRKTQAYERLAVEPVLVPLRLHPTTRATAFDSASFADRGRLYVLTDAVPVDPKRFCRDTDGSVAVCGQKARIALKRLVAGKGLSCKEDIRFAGVSFVTCSAGGRDLAETLVASGAASAATPRLVRVQEDAMQRKAGIWMDAECRARGRCPSAGRR